MDQSPEGQTEDIEEVLIKTEPIDVESTTYFQIKCEDVISIVKAESTSTCITEEKSLQSESIKSEITFEDYELEGSKLQLIKNEEQKVTVKKSESSKQQLIQNQKRKAIAEVNDKNLGCDECGVLFTRKYDLDLHKRRHSGEKPFTCDECGKNFLQKKSLSRHKLVHSGEKPFACDECGMRFSQSGHAKAHKQTHTGEQPFSCDECGTKFTRKSGLKQHKKMHTGEKIIFCDICKIKFTRKEHLVRHNVEKHRQVHNDGTSLTSASY